MRVKEQRTLNLTNKERMNLPHQEMILREPEERVCNFEEVPIGYTHEQAVMEASRCLQCRKPECVKACPVGIIFRHLSV